MKITIQEKDNKVHILVEIKTNKLQIEQTEIIDKKYSEPMQAKLLKNMFHKTIFHLFHAEYNISGTTPPEEIKNKYQQFIKKYQI